MTEIMSEFLCFFAISVSIITILVEFAIKIDKRLIVFGLSNGVICLFCIVGILLQPKEIDITLLKVQYALSAFFPFFFTWHLMLLLRKVNFPLLSFYFFMGAFLSLMLMFNVMLVTIDEKINGTILFKYVYVPYILLGMLIFYFTAFRFRNNVVYAEKKMFIIQIIAFLALSLVGIIDLLFVVINDRAINVSYGLMYGMLCLVIVTSASFVIHLRKLLFERIRTFEKLKDAYVELDRVQSLKEIGQSVTVISHELKNHLFSISLNARNLCKTGLNEQKRITTAESILDTVKRLSSFSKDILDFSKTTITKKHNVINIKTFLTKMVDDHFNESRGSILIASHNQEDYQINGDSNKLNHVFVNVIKNSLEANARSVRISLTADSRVVLCKIEDDGCGCSQEQLLLMFTTFFTTKSETGGNGLGLCIAKSIVENHGGSISIYSKNNSNTNHGLITLICFPSAGNDTRDTLSLHKLIVVIQSESVDIQKVITLFKTVLLGIEVVNNLEDLDSLSKNNTIGVIIAGPAIMTRIQKNQTHQHCLYALMQKEDSTLHITENVSPECAVLFTEEYIVTHISPRI
jgi:signal transduction histidine kinase